MNKILEKRSLKLTKRKAVSPVLATLMMIIVAVAAALVTYAWVMGYTTFITGKASQGIMIQSVGHDTTSPGKIVIYVQNVGDGTVTLSSLYINNILMADTGFIPADPNLLKEHTSTVTSVWKTEYGSPNTVKIKIVCADGTFTEVSLNNIS